MDKLILNLFKSNIKIYELIKYKIKKYNLLKI